MKRFTLLALLCLFTTQGIFSQENDFEKEKTPQELEAYYNYKYKKKRKTARALLFSGLGAMAMGAIIAPSGDGYGVIVTGAAGGGLVLLGTLSSIVSIPFFTKAKKFKRQAEAISPTVNVTLGTIRSPERNDFALGVSYNF